MPTLLAADLFKSKIFSVPAQYPHGVLNDFLESSLETKTLDAAEARSIGGC
jgi:hypothetical protein